MFALAVAAPPAAAAGLDGDQTTARVQISTQVSAFLNVDVDPQEITFSSKEIIAGQGGTDGVYVIKKKALNVTYDGNIPLVVYLSLDSGKAADPTDETQQKAIGAANFSWRIANDALKDNEGWTELGAVPQEIARARSAEQASVTLDIRLFVHYTDLVGKYTGKFIVTATPAN
ncbi:MAG TPA: hypothetical protein VFK80_07235 [Limnochordia bacterium]|nr:hypothetical protein [Limnochordia bacterium]